MVPLPAVWAEAQGSSAATTPGRVQGMSSQARLAARNCQSREAGHTPSLAHPQQRDPEGRLWACRWGGDGFQGGWVGGEGPLFQTASTASVRQGR